MSTAQPHINLHPGLKGYVQPKSPFFFEPPVSVGNTNICSGVQMGAHSYINSGRIESDVYIGRYCSIGSGVSIGTGHHDMCLLSTSSWFDSDAPPSKKHINGKLVHIMNDVWIGDKAIIMNGVTIGNGAVIGAGAIVTKDVDHYSVVAGVPAKHMKYRFPADVIQRLLLLKWWELNDALLKNHRLKNIYESLKFLESIAHTARTAQPKSIIRV